MVRTDFKKTLAERMTNPTEEDASKDAPVLLNDDGAPVVKITVSGVDEVMKTAMEDAQVARKEARRDHSKAVRVTCQLATCCTTRCVTSSRVYLAP